MQILPRAIPGAETASPVARRRGVVVCLHHVADETVDLSIVIPTWGEAPNLERLLPEVCVAAAALGIEAEIIVADRASGDGTERLCHNLRVRHLAVADHGYGNALRAGFAAARGVYLLTMDADCSHPAGFINALWRDRERADLLVASRYAPGGAAQMPLTRRLLSVLLNRVYRTVLSVPVLDLTSGFRLYRASLIATLDPRGRGFEFLPELLVQAWAGGYRIAEVPFHYQRRQAGASHARLIAFALSYLNTLGRLWRLRNSIESGDYDLRAFDSRIFLQRWWQRRRHAIVTGWARGNGPALDVGCGSSRILGDLPPGSLGLDPVAAKVRWARRSGRAVARGGLPALPVRDASFATVVCSQVIEHLPRKTADFEELARVLKPGGQLILGTPDYGRMIWRLTELLYHLIIPGGYADKHITRYDRSALGRLLREAGFEVLEARTICGGELILRCRKPRPGIAAGSRPPQ